jgi:hypothetical protein
VSFRGINDYGTLVRCHWQGKAKELCERSFPVPRWSPQIPNIRSEVWETIQVSHGKTKEVLSYNGVLETKGIINIRN